MTISAHLNSVIFLLNFLKISHGKKKINVKMYFHGEIIWLGKVDCLHCVFNSF